MPIRVDIPIRIRVDPGALTERRNELEETLVAATRRALENSREVVLSQRSSSMGLIVHSPEFIWTGDGLGAVSEGVRTEIDERLAVLLADLARAVGLDEQLGAGQRIPEPEPVWRLGQRYPILLAEVARREEEARIVSGGGVQEPTLEQPSTEAELPTRADFLQDAFERCGERSQLNEGTHIGFIIVENSMHFSLWRRENQSINNFNDFGHSYVASRRDNRIANFSYRLPANREFSRSSGEIEDRPPTIPPLQVATFYQHEGSFSTIDQRRDIVRRLMEDRIRSMLTSSNNIEDDIRQEIDHQARAINNAIALYIISLMNGTNIIAANAALCRELREKADFSEGDRANLLLCPYIMEQVLQGEEGTGRATSPPGIVGAEGIEGQKRRPVIFPLSALSGTTETPECNAFLGEPPLEKCGEEGDRLRQLIEEIAFRLQMPVCGYAGQFCISAADALCARAAGVTEYFIRPPVERRPPTMNIPLTRDERGTIRVASGNTGNLGAYEFEPSPSPAIQFQQHIAGVAPLITQLANRLTGCQNSVYRGHEHQFRGTYQHDLSGWQYRLILELDQRMKRSAAVIFGRTCQILLLQLLLTSRSEIEQRRGNRSYAQNFERVIIPQLRRIDELISLRDHLRGFYRFLGIASLWGRDTYTVECMEMWLRGIRLHGRCRMIMEHMSDYPPNYIRSFLNRSPHSAHERVEREQGNAGEIVLVGNTARIWDERGNLWTREELEDAIVSRRGIAEFFDPIVKQLVELPEEMERFDTLGVQEALRDLLLRISGNNRVRIINTRDSWSYAFKASKILESLPRATVSGTRFDLKGIHRVAHEQIGDYFQGDPSYPAGINALFGAELGFEELTSFFEDAASILLGALATVFPPLVLVELGFELTTSLIHYSEARERERLYGSLLHPEQVLTREEVEIDLFVARFALKLQLILGPAGAVGDVMQILRRTGILRRAVGRQAGRLARSAIRQSREELAQRFVVALIREITNDRFMKLLIQRLLTPVIRRIAREMRIIGPSGGIEGMRETLEMLRAERAAAQRQRRSSQPPSTSTPEPIGSSNGD